MRLLALSFAGSVLLASLPAVAQTPPAPPVTVVVVPGSPPPAPPPPVYTPPEPYYAPASPYPLVPAMERRSVGGMAAGIAGVAGGGVLLLGAGAAWVLANLQVDSCADVGPCGPPNNGPAIGLAVAGAVAIAVGIPLLIWGAKKVPVGSVAAGKGLTSPLPAWAGAPGGAGWRWRF